MAQRYTVTLFVTPQVLSAAYPWVARRLLTRDTPELRATLAGLLYGDDGRFRHERLASLLESAAESAARSSSRSGSSSNGSSSSSSRGNKAGTSTEGFAVAAAALLPPAVELAGELLPSLPLPPWPLAPMPWLITPPPLPALPAPLPAHTAAAAAAAAAVYTPSNSRFRLFSSCAGARYMLAAAVRPLLLLLLPWLPYCCVLLPPCMLVIACSSVTGCSRHPAPVSAKRSVSEMLLPMVLMLLLLLLLPKQYTLMGIV